MSYLDFTVNKQNVNIIFELGSRDLKDARRLVKYYYGSTCHSFECNPDCLVECKKTSKSFNNYEQQRIILVDKAVSINNEIVSFKPFDLSKYNNMGASSMLEIDFSVRNPDDPDYNRGNVQKEIKVCGIRLDTYMENNNISHIDLLCIDLQGYELKAIMSLGEKLKNVRYIICECSIQSTYKDGATYRELYAYLENYGFVYTRSNRFGEKTPNMKLTGFSEFDALFTNERF